MRAIPVLVNTTVLSTVTCDEDDWSSVCICDKTRLLVACSKGDGDASASVPAVRS